MDESKTKDLSRRAVLAYMKVCPAVRGQTLEMRRNFNNDSLYFPIDVYLYSESSQKKTASFDYELTPSGEGELKTSRNYVREEARQAEEQRRQAETITRLQEQQRAEQARIARENAGREAARQRRWNEFTRKNGVQEMVSDDTLTVNPFVYQGQTVAIHTHFDRMTAPDTGMFGNGNIIVTGLPRDLFRARSIVVIAGRVTGTAGQVPQLKFVGVHFCKDNSCSDMLK